MICAVLAQLTRMGSTDVVSLIRTEAALLSGIALCYACFRVIPMSSVRRRRNLNKAILVEIAGLATRPDKPIAVRHLGRLRFLVLSLVARAGTTELADGALGALSLGQTLVRIGKILGENDLPVGMSENVRAALGILRQPAFPPALIGDRLNEIAASIQVGPNSDQSIVVELAHSLHDAASCIADHPDFFGR
jgi:hypothetical protein